MSCNSNDGELKSLFQQANSVRLNEISCPDGERVR